MFSFYPSVAKESKCGAMTGCRWPGGCHVTARRCRRGAGHRAILKGAVVAWVILVQLVAAVSVLVLLFIIYKMCLALNFKHLKAPCRALDTFGNNYSIKNFNFWRKR